MEPMKIIIAILLVVGAIYFVMSQPKEEEAKPTTPAPTVTKTTAPPIPPFEGMYTPTSTYTPSPSVKDSRVWQVYMVDGDGNISDMQNTMTLKKDGTIATTLPSDVIGLRNMTYTGNSWSGQHIASGKTITFPLSFKESQQRIMFYTPTGDLIFLLGDVPPPTPAPTTPAPTTKPPVVPGATTKPPMTTPPKKTTPPPPIPKPFYGDDRFSFPITGRYVTIYKEIWDPFRLGDDQQTMQIDQNAVTTLLLSNLEIYGEGGQSLIGKYTQVYSSGDTILETKDAAGTVKDTKDTLKYLLEKNKQTIINTTIGKNAFGAYLVVDLGSNVEISRIVVTGNFAYDTIFTIFAEPDSKVMIADSYDFDVCGNKLATNACKSPYLGGKKPPVLPPTINSWNALKKAAKEKNASSEIKTYFNYLDSVNGCKMTCGFDLGRVGIAPSVNQYIVTLTRRFEAKTDLDAVNAMMPSTPHLVAFQMRFPPVEDAIDTIYFSRDLQGSVEEKLKTIKEKKEYFNLRSVKVDLSFSLIKETPFVSVVEEVKGGKKVTWGFVLNNPIEISRTSSSLGTTRTTNFTASSGSNDEKEYYKFFINNIYNADGNAMALSPMMAMKKKK